MFVDFSALDDASLLALIATSFGKADAKAMLNAAVGTLYDRYGRLVFSVALQLVGDVESSEEITQDVFVRACEGASGYLAKLSKVSTWLVSIARHRAIDELRRRSVRPVPSNGHWQDEESLGFGNGLPALDGVEGEIETTLERERVRQMVMDLPEEQRKVLVMAYFKGLSHSEIAERLEEPLGTVKSRIRLAMQRLREHEMMDTI